MFRSDVNVHQPGTIVEDPVELFSLGASDRNSVEVIPREMFTSDCNMLILPIEEDRDSDPA